MSASAGIPSARWCSGATNWTWPCGCSSPATFDRRTTGSWLADPVRPLARARADAAPTACTYGRDAGTVAELRRIIVRAEKELAST